MASVKSQCTSHRKGKEAISDPPTALDVGREAEYSKLEHSDKEEAQRNPNSECAPLIEPWYDVHPHFPKIPSDYAPLGRCFLGLVGLFDPRSSHSPRHLAPRAYPLQI